jgi:hypothetical protein
MAGLRMRSAGATACRRVVGTIVLTGVAAAGLVACVVPPPAPSPVTTVPAPTSAVPIRAAFYYPWFPQAWAQQGQNPFTNYVPTRGFYSTDTATVQSQIADMQHGKINVGIASWFGQGTTTDQHWPALIAGAAGTGFSWAPYYEPEGISDP